MHILTFVFLTIRLFFLCFLKIFCLNCADEDFCFSPLGGTLSIERKS